MAYPQNSVKVRKGTSVKVVQDTNEDIDEAALQAELDNGWELIQVVNSRIGRNKDRYYFIKR